MCNLIFLIISIVFISFKMFIQSIEIRFPIAKSLPSGEFFILYHEGINIYNQDFSLKNIIYNFSAEEKINDEAEHKKTKIEEYSEQNNFFILSLVKGHYLFIFDFPKNNLLKNIYLNVENGNNYNIIPYKIQNAILFYIVTTNKKNENNFYFYLYSIDINNSENYFISQRKYYNNSMNDEFNCNIMKMLTLGLYSNDILSCFYFFNIKGNKYILAKLFDINNNLLKLMNLFII